MSPEAHQRAYDWIDVREDLLSRVASLDPKVDSKNRNIRPMYSHLLQALRRATITLIRIIAGGQDIEDGKMPDTNDCRGCFMWKGINYLAKICEDTAFLENVEDLQRYFGVTFHDNPLAAEETLSGLDARVEHDSRGTRWDFPPRRRSFFAGLDSETMKFVYGVLRQAQRRQEEQRLDAAGNPGVDRSSDLDFLIKSDENSQDSGPVPPESDNDTGEEIAVASQHVNADAADQIAPEQKGVRPSVNMILVHEFASRTAAKQRETTLQLASRALRKWSSLAVRLRETRAKICFQYERRKRVREVASQREFLVRLKKHVKAKQLAREAAATMLDERRVQAAKAVMAALTQNLERGRSLDRSSVLLKNKLDAARTRRDTCRVMAALARACGDAKVVRQKADEMRADGLTRLSLEAFGAWAWAAGLAGRLRKRLGRADRALLENVISAWALFSKHSVEKRLRKEERTAQRSRRVLCRAWDTEILDEAFYNWAAITAAEKFHRIRLSVRVLRAWAAIARALKAEGTVLHLSAEQRKELLAKSRREADKRFQRATRRRLAEFFEGWARGAGLASRLRRRLGESEMALVGNAFSGWTMFARHSARKREGRLAAKAKRRRDACALQAALEAWINVTAADKFCRMRLSHRTFTAWKAAVAE